MPRPPAALERFVGDADRFLSDAFGRVPHLHQRTDLGALFSLADADRALTGSGLRRPAVRLVRDGDVIDPSRWTRRARTGATRIDDLVDPARALDAFDDGATIVFQSLQRWWPPLQEACRALEAELGHAVQANAYLSPAGTAGLAPHHDTHDVLIVQTHGSKDWTLRRPTRELPLRTQRSDHDAAAEQAVHRSLTLEAGDCLYLPRGWIHSAESPKGISLHLTIGVLVTTMHDVIGRLLDRAADELTSLRRAAPRHAPADAFPTAVKAAVADVLEWLDAVDPAEVADDEVHRFVTSRPIRSAGHLLDLERLDDLDDSTVVRPRTAATLESGGDDEVDRIVVRTGSRTISLPVAARPAVERLLAASDGVAVSSLADVADRDSRRVLVRRLVRDGVLAIASER